MREPVTAACAQVEPVIFDRDATIEKLARTAAEAAGNGARLLVFPEAVVPAYPSSAWAKALAGWSEDGAKEAFALLAREAVEVPGQAERRLGEIAREHELWLVTGVTERDPRRPGTLYNTLSTTARTASSPSRTGSSCRPTTNGSSGARATAAASRRSRRRTAASAA